MNSKFKSSLESPFLTNHRDCSDFSAVILAGNLGGICRATTLVNRNKCLILAVFGAARHYNLLSFCVRFDRPDLLASHKLARSVKCQINDPQVQVKFQVITSKFQVKS